jgi:hypothetical protein
MRGVGVIQLAQCKCSDKIYNDGKCTIEYTELSIYRYVILCIRVLLRRSLVS